MRQKKTKRQKATEASLSAVAIALITQALQMLESSPRVAAGAGLIGFLLLFIANEYRDVTTMLDSREVIDNLEKLSNNGNDKQ
jgi:hypothetical protein